MLTINAIVEESKISPGKMLYVNVAGYLYGLTGVRSNEHADSVIYDTQPVTRDSKPTAGPAKDIQAIGVEGDGNLQAALDLVAAVKRAIA